MRILFPFNFIFTDRRFIPFKLKRKTKVTNLYEAKGNISNILPIEFNLHIPIGENNFSFHTCIHVNVHKNEIYNIYLSILL